MTVEGPWLWRALGSSLLTAGTLVYMGVALRMLWELAFAEDPGWTDEPWGRDPWDDS